MANPTQIDNHSEGFVLSLFECSGSLVCAMKGWLDYATTLVTTATAKIEEATKPVPAGTTDEGKKAQGNDAKTSELAAAAGTKQQEAEQKAEKPAEDGVAAGSSKDQEEVTVTEKTLLATTLEKTSETGREIASKLSSFVGRWSVPAAATPAPTGEESEKRPPPPSVSATSPEADRFLAKEKKNSDWLFF